jgi:hypothetical protein
MPGYRINNKLFTDMVAGRGMPVMWERAQKCTCWDEYSGQPNNECKACGGFGYVYDEPVFENQVLIMSLVNNKEFTPIGEYKLGDGIMTIPATKKHVDSVSKIITYPENPLYYIGEWDRVTLLYTEYRTDETLVRGLPLYGRDADTLRNVNVTKIIKVLHADPDTGVITLYNKDTDYTVDDNKITWISGPEVGTRYSVMYLYHPVYIVYTQLPQSRDQDGQNLPKKVVLRFKDVI